MLITALKVRVSALNAPLESEPRSMAWLVK